MALDVSRFEALWSDLRVAVRTLKKSPAFLAVVVLSLTLGIGANSTIFSIIDALLFRPLPYKHSEQLTAILERAKIHDDTNQPPPIAETLEWKRQSHVFQDIALTSIGEGEAVLSDAGEPQRINVEDATPNFFELLGIKPILGRVSFRSEMQDSNQTVVIGYSFWKTHFNKDPHVLGKTFRLSGLLSTVVGVMPQDFTPFYGTNIDVWQPIDPESKRYIDRSDHWLTPIARLKPSVTLAQAQAEMDTISYRMKQQYPETNKGVQLKVFRLQEFLFGWARKALYPLFGAVVFILLIACANVATLLQSRMETRRGEYAVRLSLGATSGRLIQESLAESVLLSLLGGGLGLLLAHGGISLFLWLAGSDFPNAASMTVNARVFLFALTVSLCTTLLFGLVPALQSSNPDFNSALRGSTSNAVRSGRLLRRLLPILEIALAMVLLTGTGLMVSTMLRLHSVDPGFDPRNLLTVSLALPEGGKYVERAGGDMEKATPAVTNFYQRLLERVSALPGVESVGSITGLPTHFSERYTFTILGHPATPPDQRPRAGYDEVSPGFFRTLRIPLRRGRFLTDHDTNSSPWAVVVNEEFVRRFLPNEDPIGKQIRLRYDPYPTEEDRPRQIVGVVGDVKHFGLNMPAPPFIYASYLQQPSAYPGGTIVGQLWQDLAIRMAPAAQAADLSKEVRQIVAELDPEQPIGSIMSMNELLAHSLGQPRFYMQILAVFACIGVFLAGIGIYGVVSYFVSQHTHDIGIRLALGAKMVDIVLWVGKFGFTVVFIGILAGTALGLGLTRLLSALLFGVRPNDPITYFAVAVLLILTACIACYIPARRATKVDPLVALRYE